MRDKSLTEANLSPLLLKAGALGIVFGYFEEKGKKILIGAPDGIDENVLVVGGQWERKKPRYRHANTKTMGRSNLCYRPQRGSYLSSMQHYTRAEP